MLAGLGFVLETITDKMAEVVMSALAGAVLMGTPMATVPEMGPTTEDRTDLEARIWVPYLAAPGMNVVKGLMVLKNSPRYSAPSNMQNIVLSRRITCAISSGHVKKIEHLSANLAHQMRLRSFSK